MHRIDCRSLARLARSALALAALAAALSAPADAAPARGSLTLVPAGAAGAGIDIVPTGAARSRGAGVRLPVAALGLRRPATVALRGRLRLRADRKRVVLSHLRVAVGAGRIAISARLQGRRRVVMAGRQGRRLTLDRATGRLRLRRTAVALTPGGARTLRRALGLERLGAGRFGRVALAARQLERPSGGPRPADPAPPSGPPTGPPTGPPVDPPADPYAFCPVAAGSGPGTPGGQPPAPVAAPALSSPQAIGGGSIGWGFRAGFRAYVAAGDGDPPISTQRGATIASDGTFEFPVGGGATEGGADPRAVVEAAGTAVFCYPGHFFRIALLDPAVTIDGDQSRLTATVDSKLFGDVYGPWRTDVATLDLDGVVPQYGNAGQTVTWSDVPATLTAAGASAFAGFYSVGDALDPVTVVAGQPLTAAQTWIASRADAAHDPTEAIGGSDSEGMAISANGRYVAFESYADNLVAGDVNTLREVFVRDLFSHRTTRVSVDSDEVAVVGTEGSSSPQISDDGRYVAFVSDAALVAGDANGESDVYLRDTFAGTTALVSVADDGSAAGGVSGVPSMSADGRRVAFISAADGVVAGDADGVRDLFVRDLDGDVTTIASVADDESPTASAITAAGGISADGEHAVFVSAESTLAAGDSGSFRDVFVRDLTAGTTTLVSLADDESLGGAHVDLSSTSAAGSKISADGNRVVFYSSATNLVADDGNGARDCFVRDVAAATTRRINVSATGSESAEACHTNPTISADGSTVAFSSAAGDLVAGDANGVLDVFVRPAGDPAGIERANVSSAGVEDNGPDGASGTIALRADGRLVGFKAAGSALTGSGDGRYQVLVRELP
jgi:Tol biopolymer transport system component